MMKNILVPVDFSIQSLNALKMANSIARKSNGTIHLVHVVRQIYSNYEILGGATTNDVDNVHFHDLKQLVQKELSRLEMEYKEDSCDIITEVRVGIPFEEIKKIVKVNDIDLVVMGAKGTTDSEEFFIGSLTDKVIRSIDCPVLTVKELTGSESFDHIVFATDLEEDPTKIIELLIKLQRLFNSEIHIVTIDTPSIFAQKLDALDKLQQLADKYQLSEYSLCNYRHHDTEYGIIEYADEKQADLIIMGVHERSGFRRLIHGGSIADQVVNHTYRPVLTYRFKPEGE
ncbi:MAG: universal stress protein [Reichenbachiella sp.]|uniref:universal stress protein n=1 Tax=Reichenbachiella sp. TaxID=2184521 RepID=UPI003265DB8B